MVSLAQWPSTERHGTTNRLNPWVRPQEDGYLYRAVGINAKENVNITKAPQPHHNHPATTLSDTSTSQSDCSSTATKPYWTCQLCSRNMQSKDKIAHLQGKLHKMEIGVKWTCTVCQRTMQLHDKPRHVAGISHLTNLRAFSTPASSAQIKPKFMQTIKVAASSEQRYLEVQWTCTICQRGMQLHDKPHHLAGSQHLAELSKSSTPTALVSKSPSSLRPTNAPPSTETAPDSISVRSFQPTIAATPTEAAPDMTSVRLFQPTIAATPTETALDMTSVRSIRQTKAATLTETASNTISIRSFQQDLRALVSQSFKIGKKTAPKSISSEAIESPSGAEPTTAKSTSSCTENTINVVESLKRVETAPSSVASSSSEDLIDLNEDEEIIDFCDRDNGWCGCDNCIKDPVM